MSLSNDQILEAIASKSLMEIMDLVKALDTKFGVSAAAMAARIPAVGRVTVSERKSIAAPAAEVADEEVAAVPGNDMGAAYSNAERPRRSDAAD